MRGVVWLILSDWPQVPVLSQHHSSQREEKKALSCFSLLHQWIGKKTIYMQLQVNWFRRAVQCGSYTLLLSLLLYSRHTPPATEFSHRLHTLKMMSCPFWAYACDLYFIYIYTWLQDYANMAGWFLAKGSGGKGTGLGPGRIHYTLVQIQMKAGICFYMNDGMLKVRHQLIKKKKKGMIEKSCVWDEGREERLWILYFSTPHLMHC